MSRTTSTSDTEGTSHSVSKGRSWGINSSKTRSFNWSSGRNWEYGGFLGGKRWMGGNEGKSDGRSYTDGKSKGWNEGTTEGTSQSTSRSQTEGVTQGTSKSRTDGTSETIQKRALITPDEIGQGFSRVDDKTDDAYPGLALAVVAGARPFALRRINYFEDYQFIGFFDPHPDHPLMPWKDLTVSGSELAPLVEPFKLRIGAWTRPPGLLAASGDEVAAVVTDLKQLAAASIVAPRAGLVTSVDGKDGPVPTGPLFTLRFYEDGAALIDPFAQIRAMCERLRVLPKPRQKGKRRWGLIGAIAAALVLVLIVIGALTSSQQGSPSRSENTTNQRPAPPPPVPDNPSRTVKADPPTTDVPKGDAGQPAPVAESAPKPVVQPEETSKPFSERALVEVQICVPTRLLRQGWSNATFESTMGVFRTAVLDEVRAESKAMRLNLDEFEWTLDQRDSFSRFAAGTAIGSGAGQIDPRDLLTARDVKKGQPHVCPADTDTEKLLVEQPH